ncbi:MAG: hypothetical protein ACI8PZ_005977 [Myxococcota bacterium]|jgi:hypothetical protein
MSSSWMSQSGVMTWLAVTACMGVKPHEGPDTATPVPTTTYTWTYTYTPTYDVPPCEPEKDGRCVCTFEGHVCNQWTMDWLAPCTDIPGTIVLSDDHQCFGTPVISSIPPMQLQRVGSMSVLWGTYVSSLSGFSRLEEVAEDLEISSLNELHNLRGLESLRRVGGELIISSVPITDVEPLFNLEQVRTLDIGYTEVRDLRGLEKLERLWTLRLSGESIRSLAGLENVHAVDSYLTVDTPFVTSLDGLASLEQAGQVTLQTGRICRSEWDAFLARVVIDSLDYAPPIDESC